MIGQGVYSRDIEEKWRGAGRFLKSHRPTGDRIVLAYLLTVGVGKYLVFYTKVNKSWIAVKSPATHM